MRVQELMGISMLADAHILAGQNGLYRNVECVTMMDAPDIIRFLKPGELLLTTAYAIKDNPSALQWLIQQMEQRGCAGLAIKPHRFMSEIPDSVIGEANYREFPLIEIPDYVKLGDLSTEILSVLLDKKTDELQHAFQIHRQLSNLVLTGRESDAVVHHLGALLGKPVLLFNQYLQIIATSNVQDLGNEKRIQRAVRDVKNSITSRLHGSGVSLCLCSNSDADRLTITVFPFEIYYDQIAFLALLEEVSPEETFSTLALESTANVIRFEIMRQHAIDEIKWRARSEFFSQLLDGRKLPEQQIIANGQNYGLNHHKSYTCIICKIDSDIMVQNPRQAELNLKLYNITFECLENLLPAYLDSSLLFSRGDWFGIFMGSESKETQNLLEQALPKIQRELHDLISVHVSFAIGGSVARVTDLAECFERAEEVLQNSYQLGKREFVQFFQGKELIDILRFIPEQTLKQFCKDTLKDLAEADDELIQTLEVYLDNNLEITGTANQLYVHRNTVSYRVEKCKQILEVDLSDPSETLRLRLALVAKGILKSETNFT